MRDHVGRKVAGAVPEGREPSRDRECRSISIAAGHLRARLEAGGRHGERATSPTMTATSWWDCQPASSSAASRSLAERQRHLDRRRQRTGSVPAGDGGQRFVERQPRIAERQDAVRASGEAARSPEQPPSEWLAVRGAATPRPRSSRGSRRRRLTPCAGAAARQERPWRRRRAQRRRSRPRRFCGGSTTTRVRRWSPIRGTPTTSRSAGPPLGPVPPARDRGH